MQVDPKLMCPLLTPPCVTTALTCGSVVVPKCFIAVLNFSANAYLPDQITYPIGSPVCSLMSTTKPCSVEKFLPPPT